MMPTDELVQFGEMVRERAAERIGPFIGVLDRQQRFSPEVWSELVDLEMFALAFPASAGGLGGSFLAFAVATEAIASVSASAALYPGTTVQVAGAILATGTHEQIERWVPSLIAGDAPAAWAFTEPEGSNDDQRPLRSHRTRRADHRRQLRHRARYGCWPGPLRGGCVCLGHEP